MKARANHALAAAGAVAAMVCGYAAPAAAAGPAPQGLSTVQPGQSIQAAIDAARPGATIVVAAGVHHENLLVTKPLTLKGADGAVLLPAPIITPNICTLDPDAPEGNDVGICVLGALGPVPEGEDVPPVVARGTSFPSTTASSPISPAFATSASRRIEDDSEIAWDRRDHRRAAVLRRGDERPFARRRQQAE